MQAGRSGRELAGKRLVAIGGTRGIGLATALAARESGADVIVASRDAEHLATALQELGPGAEGLMLDVTDEAAVRRFFAKVGPFDHLVTTAAYIVRKPFMEASIDDARRSFDSKFWGQVYAARHGAPHIRPGGSIVLVSGISSRRGIGSMAFPAAINGAIEALGRSLAVSLAPIRVNVVSPGYIDTPDHGGPERRQTLREVASRIPARRVGQPEEVAQAILYLIANPFSTGTVLDIDGGHLAA